jgi:hypothetical protein
MVGAIGFMPELCLGFGPWQDDCAHTVSVRRLLLAVMLLALVALSAPGGALAAPAELTAARSETPCGWRDEPPKVYDSVVWIVLENHSFPELIGPTGSTARASSPYLNSLAGRCGLATDYWGITHPSLPNYIAMVSGRTGGIRKSCTPRECPQHRRTLFQQVRAHGETWRVYAESMPRACRKTDAYPYVVRHNPPAYFPDLPGCGHRDLPMGTTAGGPFLDRVRAGKLPALTLVIPDQCNNTHDCPIETGDAWLSRLVPQILDGPDYAAGRAAVLVTWDEGSNGVRGTSCRRERPTSCHLATVLISPTTEPGSRSARRFDHYSLLETTERMLGIRRHLGHAADERTHSMRRAFNV